MPTLDNKNIQNTQRSPQSKQTDLSRISFFTTIVNLKNYSFSKRAREVVEKFKKILGDIVRDLSPKDLKDLEKVTLQDLEDSHLLPEAKIDDLLKFLSQNCDCTIKGECAKTGLLTVAVIDKNRNFFTHKDSETRHIYGNETRSEILDAIFTLFKLKKDDGLNLKNVLRSLRYTDKENKAGDVCYSIKYNDIRKPEDENKIINNWRRFDFFLNTDGSITIHCSHKKEKEIITYSSEISSFTTKNIFLKQISTRCGNLLDKCLGYKQKESMVA